MSDTTQAVDREIVEPFTSGFGDAPKYQPTARKAGRPKKESNQSAGSERVTVQASSSKPTNAKKPTAVGKMQSKDLQELTQGVLGAVQIFYRPNVIGDGPTAQPIWSIDKSDPGDVQNLKQLGDSGAALINRLPDWLRKYLITGAKGGAIGVELTQFYEAAVGLIVSRIILAQMAAQDKAQAARGGVNPDPVQSPVNPWSDSGLEEIAREHARDLGMQWP